MSAVRTFTPDEVAGFQPRQRHFYHQHGVWDGGAYQGWIDIEWATFKSVHGLTDEWGTSVEVHDQFTAWLVARCPCQTPGALTPGRAPSNPPGG